MVDITHKNTTLRVATAKATVVVSSEDTIKAIKEDKVPKGNVFAMSKAAGLLGVKKTPELLPDCHPMPIEYTGIEYEINERDIDIYVTVKTIYKTGVEVEAMHAASVVALNMYDMLKPIDKGIEIRTIHLVQKTGGKSSFASPDVSNLSAAVIVCSDSVSRGSGEDKSGKIIKEKMLGFGVKTAELKVVPDDVKLIKAELVALAEQHNLVILTGGTGLSPRDATPEAVIPLLDKRMPGVEETIRRYGQERMPYAMLSRSVVGLINTCLVMALPGSSKGVAESLDAVFPALFHSFKVLEGARHE